jgi:exodeoxyribonuclease VII small subunit
MPKANAHPKSASAQSELADSAASAPSYEDAMQELDSLVRSLESGEMPLDQLLSGYQRGALLLQICRDKLQAVEDQIKVLDEGALKTWKPQ